MPHKYFIVKFQWYNWFMPSSHKEACDEGSMRHL